MKNIDIAVRIYTIRELEKSILEEPIRLLRMKKINELMNARENLRLQFYTPLITDKEIRFMLAKESFEFIQFQENLITKFGSSNAEFCTCLQNILDTCKQCEFMDNKLTIKQANKTLTNISERLKKSSNIMKYYRLRNVKKCKNILDQYTKENIENKSRSIGCCTDLDYDQIYK